MARLSVLITRQSTPQARSDQAGLGPRAERQATSPSRCEARPEAGGGPRKSHFRGEGLLQTLLTTQMPPYLLEAFGVVNVDGEGGHPHLHGNAVLAQPCAERV